ncbi:MAG: alkaline phosphatase family protein [Planctomycetota bacterium]
MTSSADAYIGPGAGFAFLGSFLALFVTIILAFGTIMIWPIRAAFRIVWKKRALSQSHVDRVVILGLDGLDPVIAARYMNEGKLPHFQKLKEEGCFRPLTTTAPSMSPVAWSSFTTGVDPSKHNIFDFLARDPKSYMSILSSADIGGASKTLKIGSYLIPLGKPKMKLLRKSIPFWKFLGDKRIFSSILRVPITFPVEKYYGATLAAMCVPDLRGTQGTFSYFTTEPAEGETTAGVKIHVTMKNDTLHAELTGPPNSLKVGTPELKAPFKVKRDLSAGIARFEVGDEKFSLKPKEYSPWVKIVFKPGLGIKVQGICRFYIMELEPDFKLYVTAIHVDPEKPAIPISHPFFYSVYLAKKFGPYATLGLAEDTWALNERVIDEEAFLKQAYLIHDEREAMYFDALDKTKKGCVACVFDATDRIQHMFMRYLDPGHPSNRDKDTTKHKDAILDLYTRMDDLLGRTMDKLNQDSHSILMVISDHGFKTFRRGINLNSWLKKEGYLHLKEGKEKSGDWFETVDWSRTRAYALGLTGMYINVKGRESQGIVEPGEEAARLRAELSEKLEKLHDEIDEKPAIRKIYDVNVLYKGPYLANSPDLLVGYHVGYRVSWGCATGKVDDVIFEDNTKSWSGDHCIDPALVPGIFFCNRPINTNKPALMDIGPTTLKLFGVTIPPHMDGVPLFDGSPWENAERKESAGTTPAMTA